MFDTQCPEKKSVLVSRSHGNDGWSNCKGFSYFRASAAGADQLVHNVPLKMFTDIFVRSWSLSSLNILGVI